MATSFCDLTPDQYSSALATQVAPLKQELARFIALNDVYSNLVDGGTTPNNNGETIRTLVTGRTVTNQSLTRPVFNPTIEQCNSTGPVAQFGQTEFTAQLETLRGEGPVVCLNDARYKVMDSFKVAEMNLRDAIKTINSADIRNQFLTLSGVKAVLYADATNLSQILTGGYNEISVPFKGTVPTSPASYKFLVALSNYMRDTLSPSFFGEGAGQHVIYIGSSEAIEILRNEAGVKQDVIGLVTGNDMSMQAAIKRYAFIDIPYRGIKLAIDQQPARFNEVDENGFPVLIEPLVTTVTDFGVVNQANPEWLSALYEVAFMVSNHTFRRLVPERYVGEGMMKFGPQFVTGELEWYYAKDSCNKWGDFGQFLYQIVRAFQPIAPHGVIPVLVKRCSQDLGLSSCTGLTDSTL